MEKRKERERKKAFNLWYEKNNGWLGNLTNTDDWPFRRSTCLNRTHQWIKIDVVSNKNDCILMAFLLSSMRGVIKVLLILIKLSQCRSTNMHCLRWCWTNVHVLDYYNHFWMACGRSLAPPPFSTITQTLAHPTTFVWALEWNKVID